MGRRGLMEKLLEANDKSPSPPRRLLRPRKRSEGVVVLAVGPRREVTKGSPLLFLRYTGDSSRSESKASLLNPTRRRARVGPRSESDWNDEFSSWVCEAGPVGDAWIEKR